MSEDKKVEEKKTGIDMNIEEEQKGQKNYLALGLSLGMLFGISIGSAMGNLGAGMAIGTGFGTALGLVFQKKDAGEGENAQKDGEQENKE